MFLMHKLLIPLLTSLALPTTVNAETIKMTKIQYFDDLSSINFFGSMVAICYANRVGYLKNNEKVQMISFFTDYHEKMHRTKLTLKQSQQKVISDVNDLFPNCIP